LLWFSPLLTRTEPSQSPENVVTILSCDWQAPSASWYSSWVHTASCGYMCLTSLSQAVNSECVVLTLNKRDVKLHWRKILTQRVKCWSHVSRVLIIYPRIVPYAQQAYFAKLFSAMQQLSTEWKHTEWSVSNIEVGQRHMVGLSL
jgi:hypothetical protein